MNPLLNNIRPHTTAILAMTADGKIADYQQSPARFGSINDRHHLEKQVSLVDGVIFGANTLRAYGTTMSVSDAELLNARARRSQPPQPIQIVVSASGNLNIHWRFFQQPLPRWLLTVPSGADQWRGQDEFERILIVHGTKENKLAINWTLTLGQLKKLGLQKLAILGGGELLASLLREDLIDELWLTVCPLILGGRNAPTPVGGMGFLEFEAKKMRLIEVKSIDDEVFLHYQLDKLIS